jgi:hypothetical protein
MDFWTRRLRMWEKWIVRYSPSQPRRPDGKWGSGFGSVGEVEEYIKDKHGVVECRLGGLSVETATEVATAFDASAAAFPGSTRTVAHLVMSDDERYLKATGGVYGSDSLADGHALAVYSSSTGGIVLSKQHFAGDGTTAPVWKCADTNEYSGFATGNSPAAVVTHEIGHAVDFDMRRTGNPAAQTAGAKIQSAAHTQYAKENTTEAWAEGFTSAVVQRTAGQSGVSHNAVVLSMKNRSQAIATVEEAMG